MTFRTNAASLSILLCSIAYFMSPHEMRAQQAASSHFGASAPPPASAAPARSTGTGGGSSWGAGKGSFSNPVQSGGVWHDGSTLGAGTGIAHNTAQAHAADTGPLSTGGNIAVPSSSMKAPSFRGTATSGTAHLSRSSAIRGSVSQSSTMSHAGGGSRSRAGSSGRGIGRGGTGRPSSLGSSLAQHGQIKQSVTDTSLHSGLDTGLSK